MKGSRSSSKVNVLKGSRRSKVKASRGSNDLSKGLKNLKISEKQKSPLLGILKRNFIAEFLLKRYFTKYLGYRKKIKKLLLDPRSIIKDDDPEDAIAEYLGLRPIKEYMRQNAGTYPGKMEDTAILIAKVLLTK